MTSPRPITIVVVAKTLRQARDAVEREAGHYALATTLGYLLGTVSVVLASREDHVRGRDVDAFFVLPGADPVVVEFARQRHAHTIERQA